MPAREIDLDDLHGSVKITCGYFSLIMDKYGFSLFHGKGGFQRLMINASSLFKSKRLSLGRFFRIGSDSHSFEMV